MPEVDQSKEVKVEKVEEVGVDLEQHKREVSEDEWIDVLGSGDLKKKVRYRYNLFFALG